VLDDGLVEPVALDEAAAAGEVLRGREEQAVRRLAVAAAVLVPYALWQGHRFAVARRHWPWFVWLALCGTVVPFYLLSWGTARVPSGLAGVLMALVPLVIMTCAHFLLPDERMTRPKLVGFALGLIGVVVLIGPRTLFTLGEGGAALLGQIAIIGTTLCYGLHATTTRLVPRVAPVELATGTLAIGAVIALPLAFTSAPDALGTATASSLISLLILGTFQTALASLVLYRLLAQAGASFTAMCNYLIPVFAVMLGAVWLGEAITLQIVVGSILVLSGIAVSQQLYRYLMSPASRHDS